MPGSLPSFRMGINGFPSRLAMSIPKKKPRLSIAQTASTSSVILSTKASTISWLSWLSSKIGVISRKVIPSLGKSGMLSTRDLIRPAIMVIANMAQVYDSNHHLPNTIDLHQPRNRMVHVACGNSLYFRQGCNRYRDDRPDDLLLLR